ILSPQHLVFFIFFTAPAPTQIYTLSLHDALPISLRAHDHRSVDADDIAVGGDERASGIAGVERGVGLDHVVDQATRARPQRATRSEEHTSELQSLAYLVCRLLLEKKKNAYQLAAL